MGFFDKIATGVTGGLGAIPIVGQVFHKHGGPPSTSAQFMAMLQAIGLGMPEIIQLQQQYGQDFAKMGLDTLNTELNGTPGTPGYLDIFSQDVVPAISGATAAANTATRTANTADLTNLGPSTLSAIRGANPAQTELMDSLTKTATDQLGLGSMLDPNTTARITSGVRGDWASRGLGTSAPAQLSEAMNLYGGGQDLLQSREAEAGTVANLNQNMYTNPLLDMIGATSNAPAMGQTMTATGNTAGANAGPTVVTQPDYMSMFDTAFNANAAQNISAGNNRAALEGAALSGAGSLGAGAMIGGGF